MDQKILFEINKFSKNPSCCFFTDRSKVSNFASAIKNLPKNSAIIVREYDLNSTDREIFARKIVDLARIENRRKSLKILIGNDITLAKKLRADGIHFSDFALHRYHNLPEIFRKNFLRSFSCHSLKSLLKLEKLKPDMIFISPIFPTTSHHLTHLGAKTLGLRNLAKISSKRKSQKYFLPNIYALGGINTTSLAAVRKLKIAGFGAIDLFNNHAPLTKK